MNKDAKLIAEVYEKLLVESETSVKPADEDHEYLYTMIEGAAGRDLNIEEMSRQEDGTVFINFSGKGYKISVTPLF